MLTRITDGREKGEKKKVYSVFAGLRLLAFEIKTFDTLMAFLTFSGFGIKCMA